MNTTATPEAVPNSSISIGDAPLTIDDVAALATGAAVATIDPAARARMQASADVVARLHADGAHVYGVTTSVGASVTTSVPPALSAELSLNLLRMHGCGTGRTLTEVESAGVLAARLVSLAQGRSGVRPEVADLLLDLLSHRVLPVIPSEGSVGASGDLTPLSYVAAVLVGEREVWVDGREVAARDGLASINRAPLTLGPKEALALMNGTSVSTALCCLAWVRARRLARLSAAITALNSQAIRGNATHFDAFVHASKPHHGQQRSAAWVAADLEYDPTQPERGARLQDRYSIRCAPHVIGVLSDALDAFTPWIETEIGSTNDNPVVDPDSGAVLHGGNFYGGHVAFAMDALKAAVASVADLLDRQVALLVDPTSSNGLPGNLVPPDRPGHAASHGFKAISIATSALTAEALKLTMPAASFSRSTESHNQDKVSMGTIAARDCLRVLELTEQVAAALLISVRQGIELRLKLTPGSTLTSALATMQQDLATRVAFIDEDRALDRTLAELIAAIEARGWPLYE